MESEVNARILLPKKKKPSLFHINRLKHFITRENENSYNVKYDDAKHRTIECVHKGAAESTMNVGI